MKNFNSAVVEKAGLLPGIHGLRAVAAIAVLLSHMHRGGIKASEFFGFIDRDFGHGVQLFFVLSAFSLMHSTQHTIKNPNWISEYFIKRLFRIAPLFYLMIIFELTRQAISSTISVNIPTIMLNFLFVFGFVPKSGIVWAGWTVGVEMIFYLIFPVLLLLIKTPKDALYFLLVSILIGYASRYVLHDQYLSAIPIDKYDWSKHPLVSNLYCFAIGIYAFKLKETLNKTSHGLCILIPIISISAIVTLLLTDISETFNSGGIDLMIWASAFGALCAWQSFRPSRIIANRFFEYLGERSYSIYLLHPVIIYFLKDYLIQVYETLPPFLGSSAFFVCAILIIGIVLSCAEFTYRLVEVPGINLGRKLIKQSRSIKNIPN